MLNEKSEILINNLGWVIEFCLFVLKTCINLNGKCTICVKRLYIPINNFEKVTELWIFVLKAYINPIGESIILVKEILYFNK